MESVKEITGKEKEGHPKSLHDFDGIFLRDVKYWKFVPLIQDKLKLNRNGFTVHTIHSKIGKFRYAKEQHTSLLTDQHESVRTIWARDHVTYMDSYWNNVVRSDKRKLNLDVQDGFSYYWRDLKAEKRV